MPPGKIDAYYAHLLRFITPSAWYRDEYNGYRVLMEPLKNGLPFKADVILFDARTGLPSFSGPLLFDFPDLSVVLFFPHAQKTPLVLGRKGTGKSALLRRLLEDEKLPTVVVTAAVLLSGNRGWLLNADGFREMADVFKRTGAD